MKHLKRLLIAATVLALPAVGLATEEARDLLETKCSVCHPVSRPLGKNKDRAGWERTVQRMQSKRPGHLSDAEVQTIIDYLAEVRGP